MKILTRYIATTVILSTITVVMVLISIESFIDFTQQLPDIGKYHYNLLTAMQYVIYQLPTNLYSMFPIAGFIGALHGLGRLSSHSELIVIRAFGYSKTAILRAVVVAAIAMIIVVTFIGEVIAPQLNTESNTLKNIALQKQTGLNASTDYWLRHNNRIIYINRVISSKKLTDITYFDFNDAEQLTQLGHAKYALLNHNQWQLFDITQSNVQPNHTTVTQLKQAPLGAAFDPAISHRTKKSSARESLKKLVHNIMYLKKSGLLSNQFEFALWQRIIQTITTLVLICLAIPFIFGSLRDASASSRTLVGIIIGFSFYMLNQFFGPITIVYQFPPILASITPTVLFAIIYAFLISKLR